MECQDLLPDGVLAHGVHAGLPDLLAGAAVELRAAEPATDGSRLLGSEIQGLELAVAVQLAEVEFLCLVHDGVDTSDALTDDLAVSKCQKKKNTYILCITI